MLVKEIGLEVNTEKINYMLLSRHQNAGNNRDIQIGNRYFENVAQFRYLGMTINQNLIQEEIRGAGIRVMLATIQSRTFCLLVCCLKI
jgi:L-amino acid N-acyltransferase YncA